MRWLCLLSLLVAYAAAFVPPRHAPSLPLRRAPSLPIRHAPTLPIRRALRLSPTDNEVAMREIRGLHMDAVRSWHALRCYERDMLAASDPGAILRFGRLIAKERAEQRRLIDRKNALVRRIVGFLSEYGDGRR